jgi:hypothetical protein
MFMEVGGGNLHELRSTSRPASFAQAAEFTSRNLAYKVRAVDTDKRMLKHTDEDSDFIVSQSVVTT